MNFEFHFSSNLWQKVELEILKIASLLKPYCLKIINLEKNIRPVEHRDKFLKL